MPVPALEHFPHVSFSQLVFLDEVHVNDKTGNRLLGRLSAFAYWADHCLKQDSKTSSGLGGWERGVAKLGLGFGLHTKTARKTPPHLHKCSKNSSVSCPKLLEKLLEKLHPFPKTPPYLPTPRKTARKTAQKRQNCSKTPNCSKKTPRYRRYRGVSASVRSVVFSTTSVKLLEKLLEKLLRMTKHTDSVIRL